ncbi:MAG: UDP-N-acetylmuramate dehydrogenase [Candidatus Omnitrophica bacterium]|nr:UDP-N-acetylmuramate dehydrogenase [Candidatus Omnitrophota bacterium]
MKTISNIKIQEDLARVFKGRIRLNESLAEHTYIKIGGPVDLFLNPEDIADLRAAIEFLNKADIPWVIIGKGSNLLVSDQVLPIAAIELNNDFFQQISKRDNIVYAAAGVSLARFVNFNKSQGLAGSEFLAGIPGSIGGAVFMNAGARDLYSGSLEKICSIADITVKVQVMDKQGNLRIINKKDIKFSYRSCGLDEQIILAAWFELKPGVEQKIDLDIQVFLNNKIKTQELCLPNAGCIFKNPAATKVSAGALIDQASLKGLAIGDAAISFIHANFIVNKGNASFAQVKSLIVKIQETVKNKYSICLEPEVKIWDREGLE